MLNLKQTIHEQRALMEVVIEKINDLYTLQRMFADSEDKFLAGYALKNAALYMNNLMINGVPNLAPIPKEPSRDANVGEDACDMPLDAA